MRLYQGDCVFKANNQLPRPTAEKCNCRECTVWTVKQSIKIIDFLHCRINCLGVRRLWLRKLVLPRNASLLIDEFAGGVIILISAPRVLPKRLRPLPDTFCLEHAVSPGWDRYRLNISSKQNANFTAQYKTCEFFGVSPLFKSTKRQLNGNKSKYCACLVAVSK